MLENKITERIYIPAQRVADLILDIGTYLLSSGAHCGRVRNNLSRIAGAWDFDIHIDPSFKGLLVRVQDRHNPTNTVTSYKKAPPHKVHLAVLTQISNLVWKTYDHRLNIEQVEQKFAIIRATPSYNKWSVAIAIGFSCAGLCFFSNGDIINALIAMLGAFIGFSLKTFVDEKKFNSMISIGMAAFATTMITGLGTIFNLGVHPEAAMATAVLYLIPGVPLINSVIDLIDGYLTSAINRALFAGFILLCIAAGMTLCITMLGISNFN